MFAVKSQMLRPEERNDPEVVLHVVDTRALATKLLNDEAKCAAESGRQVTSRGGDLPFFSYPVDACEHHFWVERWPFPY